MAAPKMHNAREGKIPEKLQNKYEQGTEAGYGRKDKLLPAAGRKNPAPGSRQFYCTFFQLRIISAIWKATSRLCSALRRGSQVVR